MNRLETKETLTDVPEIISACGIPYGFIINQRFENFGEVKNALHSAIGINSISDDHVLRITSDNELLFREIIGKRVAVGDASNAKIDSKKDSLQLYHLTNDPVSLAKAIETDNLLEKPHESGTWAARCYGLGLTCYTDLNIAQTSQALDRSNKTLIALDVPERDVAIVEKKSYWNALQEFALREIEGDETLAKPFNHLLSLCQTVPVTAELESLWKSLQALNFTSYAIDAFCFLNPTFSRRSVREQIQGNYQFSDGETATNFGYRTSCDARFLDPDELVKALQFCSESGRHNSTISDIVHDLVNTPELLAVDCHSGWNGLVNPEDKAFKKFVLLQLSLARSKLRSLINEACGDRLLPLTLLMDGFFPIGKINQIKQNLVIGTDFGSNNVAVLRHYNPSTMSCCIDM